MFTDSVLCPIITGRQPDLDRLATLLESAAVGEGRAAIITGEAGVGKSRLMAEAVRNASERGFTHLLGQCFEPDHSLPYAPVLDLLHGWMAGRADADLAQALSDSASALGHLMPELARFAPDTSSVAAGEPDKRRLFEALARFFVKLSASAPVLLVFEDLHWADDLSLELLLLLTRRIQPHRILLALTYRADEAGPALTHLIAELERLRLAVEVVLRRLSREQVELMVRAIFSQPQPLQPDFLDKLAALTDGNPFFVEEVLKSLVTAGEIFPGRAGWTRRPLGELATLRVRTAQDAVARRTQQLSKGALALLTSAAVAGQRLDLRLLQQVGGLPEADLLPLIKELIVAQMLVEDAVGHLAFRHALTRQTIITGLLAAERRAQHAKIAAAIETVYAAALEAHTPDLAHHSYEAGLWPQALHYSQAAGEDALRVYAPAAAVEHLTHALEAAQRLDQPVTTALYFARARAHQLVGVFEPALADLQAGLQAARASGDRRAEWGALLDLGLLWTSRDYAAAERQLRQALDLARRLDDPLALAHSLNRLGNYLTNLERPEEALAYHQEALRLFEQTQDQHGLAETHDLTATSLGAAGDWTAAATHYQQAVVLFRAMDNRQGLASSLTMASFRGGAYLNDSVAILTAPSVAQADAQAALELARQTGQRAAEAMAATALAFCLGPQGEFGRALDLARRGLTLAEEIEHRHWMCFGRLGLGALYLDLLDLPAALEQLEQARATAGELGSLFFLRMGGAYLISAYTLAGDLTRAQAVFAAAVDAEAPARSAMQRQVWAARSELALTQDQPELALHIVEQLSATSVGQPAGGAVLIPRLAWLCGRARLALARHAEAEADLRAAEAAAQSRGLRPLRWRILADLARLHQARRQAEPAAAALAEARRLIAELGALLPEAGQRLGFSERAFATPPTEPAPTARQALKRRYSGLTAREREVAALVAQDQSNRQIGKSLVLSQRTVEVHIANIMSKLGVDSRAQIAVWAAENGLLTAENKK